MPNLSPVVAAVVVAIGNIAVVIIIVSFLATISIMVVIVVNGAPHLAFVFLDSGAGMAFASAAGWQRR